MGAPEGDGVDGAALSSVEREVLAQETHRLRRPRGQILGAVNRVPELSQPIAGWRPRTHVFDIDETA